MIRVDPLECSPPFFVWSRGCHASESENVLLRSVVSIDTHCVKVAIGESYKRIGIDGLAEALLEQTVRAS